MATILDVIDNFFYREGRQLDVKDVPAQRLLEFGEEVRKFTKYNNPTEDIHKGCQYIGGWPSAESLRIGSGLIRSNLLFTEQILVKDQISDWFSNEKMRNENYLSSAPGWYIPGEGIKIPETRAFLSRIIPALQEARPLIEKGLIVLAPMEKKYLELSNSISNLSEQLADDLLDDPIQLARRFEPQELAIHDGQRGMLPFAGGSWEKQTRDAFVKSIKYFAREYISAQSYGGIYQAPFRYERYLCSTGIGQFIGKADNVRECLSRTNLPIFNGLSSKVIAEIHADNLFGEFRRELFDIFGEAPIDTTETELSRYMEEQEKIKLQPIIDATSREVDRGVFSKLGLSLKNNFFNITAGIGVGLMTDSVLPPIATLLGSTADDLISHPKQTVAWTALVSHSRKVEDEMPGAQHQGARLQTSQGENKTRNVEGDTGHPWRIRATPSDSVLITQGTFHFSWFPPLPPSQPTHDASHHRTGDYRPCDCGSTLKYKFCCRQITPI